MLSLIRMPQMGVSDESAIRSKWLAHELPDRNLIITTSAPNIGIEIVLKKKNPTVILLGGTLQRKTISTCGLNVLDQLKTLNIDTAFVCASGYTDSTGFSVGGQHECVLKRAIIASARRVIMLMDSSKLNSILPFTFAQLSDIDTIVTDSKAPESIRTAFRAAGIHVI